MNAYTDGIEFSPGLDFRVRAQGMRRLKSKSPAGRDDQF